MVVKECRKAFGAFVIASLSITHGGAVAAHPPVADASARSADFLVKVDRLMPVIADLHAKCKGGKNPQYCDRADSLVQVLRELAMANPSGEVSLRDREWYMELIMREMAEAYLRVLQHDDN